jgi:translocation and assembly module TamB
MRRVLKWLGWIFVGLVGLIVLLLIGVFAGANTDQGRRLIESQTASLTGGMVKLSGLSGRFPDSLRLDHIEISDATGPYLTIDGVALDWSPTHLLSREVAIDQLAASHVAFTRLPESSGKSSGSSGTTSLPVRVVLRQLNVDRIDIGEKVAGAAVAVSANGAATVNSLSSGDARIALKNLNGPGNYALDGAVDADRIRASLKIDEPPRGVIASVAKLPDLGAILVDANVDGPRSALATHLTVSAGPLRARGAGSVDLVDQSADLVLSAQAPAMTPRPDISWKSIDIDAKVHGKFTAPDATGIVRIADIRAAGAAIAALSADLAGNAGAVTLHAQADGLRIPGPRPDLLAGSPLRLDATATLNAPDRPVTVKLSHPRLMAEGSAQTAGPLAAQMQLSVPDLAPFADAGGIALQGHTDLTLNAAQQGDTTTLKSHGTIDLTGGMPQIVGLIGDQGKLDLEAAVQGQDVALSHFTLTGKALDVSASGDLKDQSLGMDWTVRLADLAVVHPVLAGTLDAKGRASGKLDDLSVLADLDGDISGAGYKSGQIKAHVDATGLPSAPEAKVNADGTLLDAPLVLALDGGMRDGAAHVSIDQAEWKSAHAEGNLALPANAVIPTGKLTFTLGQLDDLAPLLGKKLAGRINASLDSDASAAKLVVSGQGIAVPGTAELKKLALDTTITDPANKPSIDGKLNLEGVSAGPYGGGATVTARGPADAVALNVAANSPDLMGSAARLTTAGILDTFGRRLGLDSLSANWKDQTLRLLAPAHFDFSQGMAVDRLQLGIRQAVIDLAGKVSDTLDLTANIKNLPADLAAVVAPQVAADGVIAGNARITGTTANPVGTVHVTANGMHLRNGPANGLPPANLRADANLEGKSARLDTSLTAAKSHVELTGTAPLSSDGPLDLHSRGQIDLAMLNPLLAADGRRAKGGVNLNAAIAGTVKAPAVTGSVRLEDGEIQDTPLGAHLTAISALIEGTGDTIRLSHLTAKAGPGTIGGSGTVGLAGDMPVDLHLTADNARPLSSDLLTALINADLSLRGALQGAMTAGGTLFVKRADIRIPDHMPASVAVIPVRDAGAPPPAPSPPSKPLDLALDVTLDAPQQVFIRGRGLDAELGGKVHIGGTAANPQPDGGLKLRRGTLSLAGQTLNFVDGAVSFTGAGITDPSIRLVAQSVSPTFTATLAVTGSAKDPKIVLSSVPDAPQDEVLAQLLYNTTSSKLSPFQLAGIAAAVASFSGAGSGMTDPLAGVRSALGLDRLSVGSDASGNPALEAGTYVARGVYVGAKQSASTGGTQATVQIDLAKGLKLETTAGSGGSSSATGSAGSTDGASVGLTYGFEY